MKKLKSKYTDGLKEPIKKKSDISWVVKVTILAFNISMILSFASEMIIPNVVIVISVILVLFFIFLGILFDIIGIAVTTADPKIFHSMATKKIKGARTAIKMITNKEKVSSFCNDVIGDICGVISGSCGISIAIKLANIWNIKLLVITLLITSIISALTIGGKAIGKSIAVNKSNIILSNFATFVETFTRN